MEVETTLSSPLQPHSFRSPAWSDSPSVNRGNSNMFGPRLDASAQKENLFGGNKEDPNGNLSSEMSHNFHIDRQPVNPTPRRSLFAPFTSRTPWNGPSPFGDHISDVSPLRQKANFTGGFQRSTPLTPSSGGSSSGMMGSIHSSPPSESPLNSIPRRPNLAKKASGLSRPSLLGLGKSTRFSNNAVTKTSRPLFTPSPSGTPAIKLEELFETASPQGKKIDNFLAPPQNYLGADDGGSPLPVSRQSRPTLLRKQGKIRRALSMYENIGDVIKNDSKDIDMTPAPLVPSPLSLAPLVEAPSDSPADPGENSYLPSFTIKDDPLRRITRATLCDVLDQKYRMHYDEFLIVDCRFEYEYEGGHIAGAINVNTIDVLEEKFFTKPTDTKKLIIFHCEYSAHRAPRMALHLRKRDRQLNMHRYPLLHYPDIYILEGGYSNFFSQHRQRCEPQNYVEMDDAAHKRTCEKEMHRFRRNTKFTRTQSFTFGAAGGQGPPEMGGMGGMGGLGGLGGRDDNFSDGSPTGMGRDTRDKGQRRMASY
ncbi:hypothetical protein BZA77DRAFT_247634 [Pyronema omphalodes]|nr:hypothetical protein BZA77DRAFT_247634 [Pyronema omphalodes]